MSRINPLIKPTQGFINVLLRELSNNLNTNKKICVTLTTIYGWKVGFSDLVFSCGVRVKWTYVKGFNNLVLYIFSNNINCFMT